MKPFIYLNANPCHRENMTDHQDEGLTVLRDIRTKIDKRGEVIKQELEEDPSPTISDKTASKLDEFMNELEEDLRDASHRFKGFCSDTSEDACGYYTSLVDELGDLRSEVKMRRRDITGGVGETAAIKAIDTFHDRVDVMVQEQKRFPL